MGCKNTVKIGLRGSVEWLSGEVGNDRRFRRADRKYVEV